MACEGKERVTNRKTASDLRDGSTVYLTPTNGSRPILHVEKECPRLAKADEVRERNVDLYEDQRWVCQTCSGEEKPGREKQKVSLRRALKYGSAEDVITENGVQIPE